MEESSVRAWLEAYGRAWMSQNAKAAAELYSEDATYQVTPFLEPLCGVAAILEYWKGVANTESDISFCYEVLAVTKDFAIAHWEASFVRTPPGLPTKLDGIFVIRLSEAGKCDSLREWWHKQQ
jgi:ketosteroid isomerase-like protein